MTDARRLAVPEFVGAVALAAWVTLLSPVAAWVTLLSPVAPLARRRTASES